MANQIMTYFAYEHLPEGEGKRASAVICAIAHRLDETVPDGPEKSAGLRKLLEAKDCMVRAVLP